MVLIQELGETYSIVRLRFSDATAFRPIILLTISGRSQFLQLGGPEPSIDLIGQQVRTIAALEVTQTA